MYCRWDDVQYAAAGTGLHHWLRTANSFGQILLLICRLFYYVSLPTWDHLAPPSTTYNLHPTPPPCNNNYAKLSLVQASKYNGKTHQLYRGEDATQGMPGSLETINFKLAWPIFRHQGVRDNQYLVRSSFCNIV